MSNSRNALTETTFLILLSLTTPKHGYAVIQEVLRWTEGRVKVAPGTLYSALENLRKKEWIKSSGKSDNGRKEYQLTETGFDLLRADYERLLLNIDLYEEKIKQGGKDHEKN